MKNVNQNKFKKKQIFVFNKTSSITNNPSITKHKKAQVEVQFNWIFILIAGAMILVFFFVVVSKQRAAAEVKYHGQIKDTLNSLFIGAQQSSGTAQDIDLPKTTVKFECYDYYIGDVAQRLGERIIFVPDELKGTDMLTWTLDWNVPFKITNFLLVTNSLVKYYVVYDSDNSDFANQLYKDLPAKLNKELKDFDTEYDGIINQFDNKVRFIFIGTFDVVDEGAPSDLEDQDISALQIVPGDSTIGEKNKLLFYEYADGSFSYLDKASYLESPEKAQIDPTKKETRLDPLLYGAIFTENYETYTCNVKKALNNYKLLTAIYLLKTEELRANDDIKADICKAKYSVIDGTLSSLYSDLNETEPDFSKINSAIQALIQINNFLQLRSCPLIY